MDRLDRFTPILGGILLGVVALGAPPHASGASLLASQITTHARLAIDVFEGPDGSVYTLTSGDTDVRRYDPITGLLTETIDVGREFRAGYVTGETLYAIGGDWRFASITVVDLPSRSILETYDIPGVSFAGERSTSGYADIEPSPDGSRLYAKIGYERGLVEIDTATRSVVGSTQLAYAIADIALSPDGQTLYGVDASESSSYSYLYVYDLATGTLREFTTYVLRSDARTGRQQLAVNPANGNVYVGYARETRTSADYEITEFTPDGVIERVINPKFGFGEGLGVSLDGRFLVAGNGEIYDLATDTLAVDLAGGIASHRVFMTDGGRAYVSNYNSTFITVINGLPVPEPSAAICALLALSAMIRPRS
jgi:DNA-binding beta-propeller fold protein YncE